MSSTKNAKKKSKKFPATFYVYTTKKAHAFARGARKNGGTISEYINTLIAKDEAAGGKIRSQIRA